MILVDSSVWTFVIGEVACRQLRQRATLAAGRLWTRDRRLAEAAVRQGVAYPAALH